MAAQPFPTIAGWTQYQQLVDRYQALLAEQRTAQTHANTASAGESEARHADDLARSEAIREGTKDPGAKHHAAWVKAHEAATDTARVLGVAVAQQEDAINALLAEHRDDAMDAAQAAHEDAADAYREALDGILSARERFHATAQVLRWLEHGQPQGRRFKATPAPGLSALANPTVRGGDPLPADVALAAFRGEVDPPEPEPVPTHRKMVVEPEYRGNVVDSVTYRSVPQYADGQQEGR